MKVLEGLKPAGVFGFFEEMCAIPHGSGNTKFISDYLVEFAKARGLEYYRDKMNNVIIIKQGTPGYENSPAVILQGHMDMVCEKAPDCTKNMTVQGLDLVVEGDTIYAKGTTLGGDNGIGVAMALALLDAEDISHPRLEAVFTVDEEIGMLGAVGLSDVSMLKGKSLINLDSEEEGVFTVSCAGGNVTKCVLPVSRSRFEGQALEITVAGLGGGHSGIEIHKGLGNASKLLGRLLFACSKECEFRLVEIRGGLKDNAIPREAQAVIITDSREKISEICAGMEKEFKNEYKITDSGVYITVKDGHKSLPMDEESTKRAISFVSCCPNGIQSMSASISGLVQTSLNLGILASFEDRLEASFCVRSSVDSEKQMLVERLEAMTGVYGGNAEVFGDYSGWEYMEKSPLRTLMCEVYKEQYGKEPVIEAIHAGVECGIFTGKIPGLDCISIGPKLTEIHTCRERAHISSIERVWEMVLETIKRMK